jgi:SagB-type dehydrogenase family enzyme
MRTRGRTPSTASEDGMSVPVVRQHLDPPMAARRRMLLGVAAAPLGLAVAGAMAQSAGEGKLPAPQTEGGLPLMQALKRRRTTRSLAPRELPPQVLSNLLWAAFGINRPDGHRTAPSARNWQEIDVYVVMASGAYLYDARDHGLQRVVTQDVRALAGTQAHARSAPVTLVYVADARRMSGAGDEARTELAGADTGFIAQNAYLYCASEGLGTVVFASIDRERLAQALKLDRAQRIVLGQSVGYPAQ